MNTSINQKLLTGIWLMHPHHALSVLPIVAQILRGDQVQSIPVEPKLQVATATDGVLPGWYSGFTREDIAENSIAIIPVKGAIMKEDGWWGEPGTEKLTDWVKQANANPNISAILFRIDSPGGMVDGTQTFAQAIASVDKPTLSLVDDGLACSAGQWIASAANKTWISQKTCTMGSIGVYATLPDINKYYKKLGLDIHEIYSDFSPEKNKDFREALKGNYKPFKENHINPIAQEFIADMLEYRAGKIAPEGEHLQGKTYMGMECIEAGLADKLGSFDEAIDHLLKKSTKKQTSNQFFYSNNNQMKFKSAWTAILGAIGFANVASEDEAPQVNEERLEQLNSSLEAANKTIVEREATIATLQAENKDKEQLTASVATLTKENETLTASVATLTTERDDWKQKAEKYGKQAGVNPGADTKTDKESEGDSGDTVSEEEQFMSYDHNKKAMDEIKNIA